MRAPGVPWSQRVGERFGRIVIVSTTVTGKAVVRCDCGTEKTVSISNVLAGRTKSCGCLQREVTARRMLTHGMSRTREYHIWAKLIQRCEDPNHRAFKYYGGRGITVCERWRSAFENFNSDMGPRPSSRYSVERKDNSRGYEPSNCVWATAKEQARNTRRNVWLEHNGRRMLAIDWAAHLGITRQAIEQRIKAGWSVERICTEPCAKVGEILRGHVPGQLIHFRGRSMTLSYWAAELGVGERTLRARLARGMTVESAFTNPVRQRISRKAA
jgi:hypothetical protein